MFKLRDFESAVDRIRDSVAERLWKLLVEDSGLVAHLQVTGLTACTLLASFNLVFVIYMHLDPL